MATYPNTGSILDSTMHTALSTQIIILVNNEPVGAIQKFAENQQRMIKEIPEVGTDGHIEAVPHQATKFSIDVDRIVYDGLSLPESFSRGFRNINAQRIPFDIVVIDNYSGSGDDAVVTTYHECWFNKLGRTYNAGDYVITQNAGITVTYVSSQRGGEAVALSQGAGGGRQINGIQLDPYELDADSGLRRGALDAEGILSAAF